MARRVEELGDSIIVYDDTLVSQIDPSLFDPARWSSAPAAPGYSGGRGTTLFLTYQQQQWVLRHYHRGGLIGRLFDDAFVWTGAERTRAFREWSLLDSLTRIGLPVPKPVAGRCRRRGLLYAADLITVRIPGVEPLSSRLAAGPVTTEIWRRVGELVGRFHLAGVFHADLTAHNIQIDSKDRLHLLDFDRGRMMSGTGNWMQANLNRLQRSFAKISRGGGIDFSPTRWEALLAGYYARLDSRVD